MKKKIKIFIISPSDVEVERQIAKKVCIELDTLCGNEVDIMPILWEDYPMDYWKNAQANIDDKIDECDIFIVILWKRLGSIVHGFEGALTGMKTVTGTQYEIEKILALKKENIYFYFKTKEKHFTEDELEEALYQKELLGSFLNKVPIKKGTSNGYHQFYDKEAFHEKLMINLSHKITDITGIYFDMNSVETKNNIDELEDIHPNYFVGLYMFLTVICVMLFLTTQLYSIFSKMWEPYIIWFSVSVFGMIAIAIQGIPVERERYKKQSFKIIFYTLIRRGTFIFFSSLLISAFIVLFVLPSLQNFLGTLFYIISE